MRYIVQAIIALAVLIGLPVFFDTPTTTEGIVASGVGALILAGIALRSVLAYVRSRKPQKYLDSIMPPVEPPRK